MRFGLTFAGAGMLAMALCGPLPGGGSPAWATSSPEFMVPAAKPLARALRASARIVPTSRPIQCVPYARKVSGIQIRGDAWTWWESARGRYERGPRPRVGAVLVMKKTNRLRRGHLAVVKRVLDGRTIIVDQANWLNRGRVHLNSAVRDVSPKNDWSALRVWYTPGARYGSGTYSANGFIYAGAPRMQAAGLDGVPLPRRRPEGVQLAHVDEPASASAARSDRRSRKPTAATAKSEPDARLDRLPPRRTSVEKSQSGQYWHLDSRRG